MFNSNASITDQFQLVILECPYNTFQNPLTQKLFGQFIEMKLRGYLEEYPHGTLPLGSYDFIGNLIMLCKKQGDQLEPILCFKSTSLSRVKHFGLPFELLDYFHSPAEELHLKAVCEIIARAEAENTQLGYNSSWTIAPAWRMDPAFKLIARELSVALFTQYYCQKQIHEILICGTLRFKVDRIQSFMGFEYLKHQDTPLPPVETWFARGEKVTLMHLKKFSKEALKLAEQYQTLWEQRLMIGESEHEEPKQAA